MPKMRMRMPAAPAVHTKRYSAFRGVDFSTDPSQVDDSRSPWAVNIIADAGGCPQKRPGWRMLTQVEAPVRGIHRFEATVKSKADSNGERTQAEISEFIVHAGSKLYRWQGGEDAPTQIMDGLTGDASSGFMYNDCLYILTGEEYVYVKATLAIGATVPKIKTGNMADGNADAVYIPITRCDIKTASYQNQDLGMMGEAYEEASMVTCMRRNKVIFDCTKGEGNDNGSVISLDAAIPDGTHLKQITIETEQGTRFTCDTGHRTLVNGSSYTYDDDPIIQYAYLIPGNAINAGWQAHQGTVYSSTSGITKTVDGTGVLIMDMTAFYEVMDYNDDTSQWFTVTYPAEIPKVELSSGEEKEYTDYFDRIRKCRIFNWYNSRLFVAGNPDYPNADWYSEVGDPTYFKEINYTEIGNEDSKILGYLPVGEQQAVIKSDSVQIQDASVYLRRAEWDETDGYFFPLRRGVIGIGALGFGSFATLIDDGMYLSSSGVMGVITENITGERVVHSRSTRINNRLLKEPNLERAICCTWNGYMLIAVNGNVYVADSRQKSYVRNETGTFEYEWYFWDSIPAELFKVYGDELFFATADGKICKFNTDLYDENGEVSLKTYSDWPDGLSGEPSGIISEWATKFDDDGDFMVKKNLVRRGCGVFLKGARKGNIKVLIRTDKTFEDGVMSANRKRGVFSWDDIDFDNFTFETIPRLVGAFNVRVPDGAVKIKKYSAIQVIVRSDEANNDFGVLGIERRFVPGYYEK